MSTNQETQTEVGSANGAALEQQSGLSTRDKVELVAAFSLLVVVVGAALAPEAAGLFGHFFINGGAHPPLRPDVG